MSKKNPPSRSRSRSRTALRAPRIRRLLVLAFGAGIAVLQASSCGFQLHWPPQWPAAAPPVVAPAGPQVRTRFAGCPQLFAPGGMPSVPGMPQLRELCFDSFAVLHSGQTRTPVFVAERISRQLLQQGKGLARTDRFFADARLPSTERARLDDYKGSGYSRGHMAPAGDMPTPAAMAQSFSLANMVPQDQRHNAGPWARVEADTRAYAQRAAGHVYVITGPVFGTGAGRIASGRVAVPTHLFKLVFDPSTNKAWAHWQENSPKARVAKPISYGELVRRTGMELLPGLH